MSFKKYVLYGKGNARDHVNHLELSKNSSLEVYSLIQNENTLMEKECNNVIRVRNIEEALILTKKINPDIVMISNRDDLANGTTEKFKKNGFKVFGINKDAAKLEICKEYSKEFMKRNNIKTPNYYITDNEDKAIKFINENWNKTKYGFVIKVSEFSKNSFERTAVPETLEMAIENIHRLFASTQNAKIIIEERLKGYELSVHVFINEDKYSVMPMVQDYKRKYPNDEGPMTAGTASIAEGNNYPPKLLEKIKKQIIEPTISGLKKEGIEYNYILYIGIIVTKEGEPIVLEYNTRTGNPEWIALLGLLNVPFNQVMDKFYENCEDIDYCWKKDYFSIAIAGFSAGYPEFERSNFKEPIKNLKKVDKDIDVFGEHIVEKDGIKYPSGGRVFILRKVGKNFQETKESIIKNFYKINMNGLYFRYDITSIEEKSI